MRSVIWILALLWFGLVVVPARAADAPAPPAAPAPPDVVTLKDGSVIYGEVVEMSGGVLFLTTAASPDKLVKFKWDDVVRLSVNHPIPFHLKEGTILTGTATSGSDGVLEIHAAPLQGSLAVPMSSVTSVNPLVQPPVIYVGSFTGGFSQTTGNSHLRNASFLADFVARGEQLRLTMNARYVYGDNANTLTARNGRATIKLDFFLTKRLFWFASAYFESDHFQDLKLRTSIATGPGYQIVDRGDYSGPTKDMTWYAEAGIAYFNEDYNVQPDQASTRARLSTKFNWPMLDERITLYNFTEFYPSLQNVSTYYLSMDNGARFNIWEGFVFSFQYTLRFNSKPAPGTGDTDNLYLITVGYSFDTTRKR